MQLILSSGLIWHFGLILLFLDFGYTETVPEQFKTDLRRQNLTLLYEWTRLDYAYESAAERERAVSSEELIYSNNIPIDVDVFYLGSSDEENIKRKIFVTVPRFAHGIPSSLNLVTDTFLNAKSKFPVLQPYPDWTWHRRVNDCPVNRITSVFRMQTDKCNRLWVLDTGKIGTQQVCPPQILAFDIVFDRLVYRHEIPQSVLTCNSLLITPVVDMREYCNDVFIYAADVTAFGIIVHDVKRGMTWRVENKLMYPFPSYGTYSIQGENFDFMDGIFGMAISPYKYGQDRILYFHSLASVTENYVFTSVLRNDTPFKTNFDGASKQFHVFPLKRSTQSAAEAMDDKGVMYFGLLSETSIMCWNSKNPYGPINFDVLDKNPKTLQFPSGIKIVHNLEGIQELWVSTCRFQKLISGTMNFETDLNFRIHMVDVDSYLLNSRCVSTPDRSSYNEWKLWSNNKG